MAILAMDQSVNERPREKNKPAKHDRRRHRSVVSSPTHHPYTVNCATDQKYQKQSHGQKVEAKAQGDKYSGDQTLNIVCFGHLLPQVPSGWDEAPIVLCRKQEQVI